MMLLAFQNEIQSDINTILVAMWLRNLINVSNYENGQRELKNKLSKKRKSLETKP